MNYFKYEADLPLEYKKVLKKDFIDPLIDLGFEWEKYGHVKDEDDLSGTHIMKFKRADNLSTEIHKAEWEILTQICTQDDDSQPEATFKYYAGTLWLYIPYSA